MKTQKCCFIIIVILLILFKTNAQDKYSAVHWDTEDGLAQGITGYMLKDIQGFLWISTENGLSRFDGSTSKNYYAGINKRQSIIGNQSLGLIEDSLHNIWVGTDKGLSRYDIKADTFSHFFSALSPHFIDPFWATKDEVFCIENDFTITSYNIHSFTKKIKAKVTAAKDLQLNDKSRSVIFDGGSSSVWILQGYSGQSSGGLFQVSFSDGKSQQYTWPCYRNIPKHSHDAEGLRYDRLRNCLWINSTDGLMQFTLSDKKFHHIEALNKYVDLKDYGRWVGIDLDPLGRVWLATQPKGIIIYDPANQSVKLPFADDTLQQTKVSESNYCIYCDRDNIVWSGFWVQKGIYQLIPISQTVTHYGADKTMPYTLSNNMIINSVNADHGKIWFGTIDGLNIFDIQTGLFQVLHEKDLPGIKGKEIIPVTIDTIIQKAWLWTEKGYFEMSLATKNCEPVIFKNRDNEIITSECKIFPLYYGGYCGSHKIGCILPARYGDQLYIFIAKGDSAVASEAFSFPLKSLNLYGTAIGDDHLLFLQDRKGTTLTYSKLNSKWVHITTPIDTIKRGKLTYNKDDQSYWVIAEGQLIHYNKTFQLLHRYTEKDELPVIEIYGIIVDNDGNIWFNTDRSISKLNIETGKIITLSEKDGFQKQNFCIGTSVVKDVFGDIYFPSGVRGAQGFDKVTPSALRETYPSSSVYFRSLLINQNSILSVLGINSLNNLSVKYFQNNITIETGTIDYYSKGVGRIRYKLEGINDNWQYAPANYNIRYDGLPPGKYKLLIQASNAANEFIGPVKSLLVKISPPFWKTWWFISLIAIIIILALNSLFQFRLKQKLKVLKVRQRLHRDLHDDVGATLSSIKVYSEILQTNSDNPLITELIKNNAVEMIDKLEVIAWAINPQNDSFKSFKEVVTKHASTICYAKNIDLVIQSDGVDDNMIMPGDIRQNLFLIFKEAINNVIKHSNASQCRVEILMRYHKFSFKITDNGNGFCQTKGTGNGRKNMQKRAEELNGKITIDSEEGKGTMISINLPGPPIPLMPGRSISINTTSGFCNWNNDISSSQSSNL